MTRDPRLTPARPDLAAAHLRGQVAAARYVEPERLRVTAPLLDMVAAPGGGALVTQLLHGEAFDLYERDAATGMAWGQCGTDGYVGYVDAAGVGAAPAPDRRVVTLGTQVYGEPRLKSRPVGWLPFLAALRVEEDRDGFARIGPALWCPAPHLAPVGEAAPDFVAVAERLLGVPYLWGGRSNIGLDCSALVQLALLAAGRAAPRDSDQQQAMGSAISGANARGDLVFWRGHVGIMRDARVLLHANAHHMAVVSEPLADAVARIEAAGAGPVTAIRRL